MRKLSPLKKFILVSSLLLLILGLIFHTEFESITTTVISSTLLIAVIFLPEPRKDEKN